MNNQSVGVIGASSLVGTPLLTQLSQAEYQVTAFTRHLSSQKDTNVKWRDITQPLSQENIEISQWVCVAPIWVLPEHFTMLGTCGIRRLVALSSTSVFTKETSSDPHEQDISQRLASAESQVQAWAISHNVEWIILRPTLIYGFGRDRNIAEIARFILHFGFFPVFGKAQGLRQPLHAQDVADACVAALMSTNAKNHAYNLSGDETITYRNMVARIFTNLHRPVRLLAVPLPAFRLAIGILRLLPRYRKWSSAMAERMNQDLVFDHSDATHDFGFKPRPFLCYAEDMPTQGDDNH